MGNFFFLLWHFVAENDTFLSWHLFFFLILYGCHYHIMEREDFIFSSVPEGGGDDDDD